MFQCNLSESSHQYDESMNRLYQFLLVSALLFEGTWMYVDHEFNDLRLHHSRFDIGKLLNRPEINDLIPKEIEPCDNGIVSAEQKEFHEILLGIYDEFVKHPPVVPPRFVNNLKLLESTIQLTKAEQLILVVAAVINVYGRNQSILELLKLPLLRTNRKVQNDIYVAQFLCSISDCSMEDFKNAFQRNSTLLKYNFFDGFKTDNDDLEDFFDFEYDFCNGFLNENEEVNSLLGLSLTESHNSKLTLDNFEYLNPKLTQTAMFLASALDDEKKGINILLYGSPGTGKTELSKAIASHIGANLFESPVVEHSEHMTHDRRVSLMRCLAMLKKKKNSVMLVDEAQDIFQNYDIFNFQQSNPNKGFINKLLETNECPVIWITNSIDQMDPAYLRRFAMCLEVEVPPQKIRVNIINEKTCNKLSEKLVKSLAERTDIAPAVIEQSANFAKEVSEKQGSDMEKVFVEHLNSTLSMMHKPAFVQNKYSFTTDLYDPSFSTADANLVEMVDGIKQAEAARLCLYGVPGTGKTAWAQHLGKCLNRPVLVKRCSDLLDCYLGNSEKHIAAAFAEAKRNDAILVLDEADSFLQKRSGAHYSWEVTQVNEMLTQIEHFDGIFVATTNNLDQMDEACLRRFDIKVKFDYLKADKAEKLFVKYCEKLCPDKPISEDLKNQVRKIDYLAPGDFATVANQSQFRRIETPEVLLQRLEKECEVKLGHSHHRSIGF